MITITVVLHALNGMDKNLLPVATDNEWIRER